MQKEGKGTHTVWTDREEPRGESKFWVGSKGNPKYTETSLGAPQKFQLQPRGAVSLCSAPGLPQGEIILLSVPIPVPGLLEPPNREPALLQVGPRRPRSGCGNRPPLLPSGKNHKPQPALVPVKQPSRCY